MGCHVVVKFNDSWSFNHVYRTKPQTWHYFPMNPENSTSSSQLHDFAFNKTVKSSLLSRATLFNFQVFWWLPRLRQYEWNCNSRQFDSISEVSIMSCLLLLHQKLHSPRTETLKSLSEADWVCDVDNSEMCLLIVRWLPTSERQRTLWSFPVVSLSLVVIAAGGASLAVFKAQTFLPPAKRNW